ncbi:MAG: addiction module protein [Bacteroidota bacterium]|nr:addiction module protein [Bacteroidota bacterium]
MTQILQDILKLSVSERILMVEAIWDSIPEDEGTVELSDETKQLLDDRLLTHLNNPTEGSTWEEVKSRIKIQF